MNNIIKIIKYSWSLKRYYLITMGLTVTISIMNQADPFFFKFVTDGLQKKLLGQAVPLRFFVLLIIGIGVIKITDTILSNISGFYGDVLGAKLETLLSQRYYDHVLELPIGYFDNEVSGKITNRLDRGINTITSFVTAMANNFIGFILTSFITLGIMAYYSWPVALAMAALFPFYIWLTSLSSKAWQKKQEGINKDMDFNRGRVVEAIGQIRVVKSFVQEIAESRLFKSKRTSIEQQVAARSIEWHKYDVARRMGLSVVFIGIYAYIIYLAFIGHISVGTFILMVQLATQAQFPLFASSFIIEQIQQTAAGSKDYFEVMETKPLITDKSGAKKLTVVKGVISYKDVEFSYDGSSSVLKNITFEAKAGSKVALVGESGQGKTTVANLMLRFYDITKGAITIDGQNIHGVTQASLRSAIGVVFQEPALFSGTIRDNVRYGTPKASEEDIVAAAKAANAHDFIEKLPKGYNSEIGERGVKLSGGQKQRIAIARAILKNPPILILDEATSSLDSKAEHEVQTALEQLMKARTTLIIAHRLSTIQNVDLIVGLKDGKVAESGSPAELAKLKGGIYAELLELQQPTKANKAKLKKYDIARV